MYEPVAIIDKHAVGMSTVDIETKCERQCLGFFQRSRNITWCFGTYYFITIIISAHISGLSPTMDRTVFTFLLLFFRSSNLHLNVSFRSCFHSIVLSLTDFRLESKIVETFFLLNTSHQLSCNSCSRLTRIQEQRKLSYKLSLVNSDTTLILMLDQDMRVEKPPSLQLA